MSGRDPDVEIPDGFRCEYADPGERACPAWRCDCFVGVYDDPFGLHPEAFVVEIECGYCGEVGLIGGLRCASCGRERGPGGRAIEDVDLLGDVDDERPDPLE